MTDDSTRAIDRRTVLKTIGATGLAGAGAVALTTGPATAANFDIGEPVAIESDDGTVEYVAIYGDSVVNWDGFDEPAHEFDLTITADVVDADTGDPVVTDHELHSVGPVALDNTDWGNYDESLSGVGTSGSIESGIGLAEDGTHDATIDWHIVGSDPDGYGLPTNSLDASALSSDTDGETASYTVTMMSTYTWYDGDDNPIFDESFESTIPVDVTNIEESSTSSDGDGDDGAVAA